MREAAETLDDLLVSDGILGPLCIAGSSDQLDRKWALLAVLERHVEKQPLLLRMAVSHP